MRGHYDPLVKKPKLDNDQEENDNLRKEEDEWEWYWNCKSSLNQKKSPHGSWVASFSPSDWVRCRRRSKIGGLVGTEPARWRNKPTSCEATVGLLEAPVGGVRPKGDTLLLELLLLLGISMYFGVCTLLRPCGGLFDNRSSSSSSSLR